MNYKTEQEDFWAGHFGDDYINRNQGENIIVNNIALFAKILNKTISVSSILEFGANIGLNLQAIKQLLPKASLSAIEINKKAADQLKLLNYIDVYNTSILDFKINNTYDLSIIKGVLIHISPNELPKVYEKLYQSSNKYICISEYYSPYPVEVRYRGYEKKLFKRDFAGEMLDKYLDLKLIDYGFVYHRDNNFPLDDSNWFLLKKC